MAGLIVAGSIAAAGALAGGLISSHAAGQAAGEQSQAAMNAAQLQYQASQNALGFQKQQYATSQQEMMPWLQSGQQALGQLNYMMGMGGQPATGADATRGAGTIPVSGGPSMPAATAMNQMPGGYGTPQAGAVLGAQDPRSVMYGTGAGAAGAPSAGATGAPSAQPGGAVNPNLGGYGSLMQPWTGQFQAPTNLTEQNDPGYQARLQLGTDTLQRSAAARGNVLTGGTAKALDTYAQDYASNEYNNVYNRAFNQYATNYNQYQQNQANQFNRLSSLAGGGQVTAQQLGTLGANTANAMSSNVLGTAANMGQAYQTAAAANASGIYNQAQAWNQGIGGGLSALNNYMNLSKLQNTGGGGYNPNNAATVGSIYQDPAASASMQIPYEPLQQWNYTG